MSAFRVFAKEGADTLLLLIDAALLVGLVGSFLLVHASAHAGIPQLIAAGAARVLLFVRQMIVLARKSEPETYLLQAKLADIVLALIYIGFTVSLIARLPWALR